MFEQSGIFKNEFIRLGVPAEDYDIRNNFGQTDNIVDLFVEIEKAYEGDASIFDKIGADDLIMAFFPCIYFEALQMTYFMNKNINLRAMDKKSAYDNIIDRAEKGSAGGGICSEERSMMSPEYARNFICDFILGKENENTLPELF